jgi:hypothetical protein
MWTPRAPLCLLLAAALAACGNSVNDKEQSSVLDDAPQEKSGAEPERIAVDHILVGVKGPNFPNGKYTEDEARKLAYRLLDELESGADWAELKRRHSEDRPGPGQPPGGPYAMANNGVMPRSGEYPRGRMVGAFGNVGFELDVGEIGIADYDPNGAKPPSPFGYHLIKRVK